MIYGYLYRNIMTLAHKYNWHYAPPIYPDGDTQLWCQYCGFRETIKRKPESLMEMHAKAETAGITLREYITHREKARREGIETCIHHIPDYLVTDHSYEPGPDGVGISLDMGVLVKEKLRSKLLDN